MLTLVKHACSELQLYGLRDVAQSAMQDGGRVSGAAWGYAMREAAGGCKHADDGAVPWRVLAARLTPEEEALLSTVAIAGVTWANDGIAVASHQCSEPDLDLL